MPNYDAQRWVFTLNNWTVEMEQVLLNWFPSKVKYLLYKPEVGESGTPHLQGIFVTATRMPKGQVFGVRNGERIGFTAELPSIHLEVMRGTLLQAMKYVKKDATAAGEVTERGDPPMKGNEKLTDQLQHIRDDVKTGMSPNELELKYDIIDLRYPKFMAKQQMTTARHYARQLSEQGYPEVFWLYGIPGSGKTTNSIKMSKCLTEDYFILDDNQGKIWWDGYAFQETVILDDVDPRWMTLDFLKSICDRARETRLPVKGSTTYLTAKFVFITSVDNPQNIYGSAELNRRVRHLIHVGEVQPTAREGDVPALPADPPLPAQPPAAAAASSPCARIVVPAIDVDSDDGIMEL